MVVGDLTAEQRARLDAAGLPERVAEMGGAGVVSLMWQLGFSRGQRQRGKQAWEFVTGNTLEPAEYHDLMHGPHPGEPEPGEEQ